MSILTIPRIEMRDRIDDEITFRKLEVLLAFMETGNLAKAAEALNVSTVSVHRALHSLEQGVRCALFRHEGRNLKSTEAAQMLADVAQEVMTLMSDGIRATREAAGAVDVPGSTGHPGGGRRGERGWAWVGEV